MYQQHMYPSMSVIRRSISHKLAPLSNCSSRNLHVSARRCVDTPSNSTSASTPSPLPENKRARSRAAASQVVGLQNRRPQPAHAGLAAGRPPSTQRLGSNSSQMQSENTSNVTTERPLIRKTSFGRAPRMPSQSEAAPLNKMVRAPANLRITRNATGSGPGGPNLRSRRSAGPGENRTVGRGSESAPKRRERKTAKETAGTSRQSSQDVRIENTLSNGMVQQLLRLQRKEWDRVPYEPKYGHQSKEALELIEAGKKLFEGEVPVVKEPGRLERRIGIVGMHGA